MRGRRREPRGAFIPSNALSNRKGWKIQRILSAGRERRGKTTSGRLTR